MTVKDTPETEVVGLWRQRLAGGGHLITTAGERVQVLYPGRANGDGGPDFRDAVIVMGGRWQLRGDIELHVSSGQWQQHGHHHSPVYNNVILHVVLWDKPAAPARLESHGLAPVVALGRPRRPAAAPSAPREPRLPCHSSARDSQRLPLTRVEAALDEAGEARFRDKAARFQGQMQHQDGDQVAYQGLLRALGYSKNQEAFEALARALPYRRLAQLQAGSEDEIALALQALLLGGAGLLPGSPGGEPWLEALESAWRRLGPQYIGAMRLSVSRGRVRPENSPARRLAGAALLVAHYREPGLAAAFQQLAAAANTSGQLETALTVPASGFWASHLNFDIDVRGQAPALVGRGRAADIIVNVVLPFAWAADARLRSRALALYRQQPCLEENSLTRHMRQQLGLDSGTARTAARQQGLLHIYKSRCTQGGCPGCPFNA